MDSRRQQLVFHSLATQDWELNAQCLMLPRRGSGDSLPPHHYGKVVASPWVWGYLGIMFVNCVLFMVAFLTPGWGSLTMPDSTDYWQFGLWQVCRHSDGVCLGTRWPVFYTATRALAVFTLFGYVLSFAWMLGHTLEKLLDYDPCGLWSLISLTFTTAVMGLACVSVFGARWPVEFGRDFEGTTPKLGYSFVMSCVTVPLNIVAGAFSVVEERTSLSRLERRLRDKNIAATHFIQLDDFGHRVQT